MIPSRRPKRKYNSSRRKAQAQGTRRQIIEAARRCFTESGYNGATMESIAKEAGVSVESVFAIYGNKRNLLAKLVDVSVGGDDQPVPILERPVLRAILNEVNPERLLKRFAADIVNIFERVAPLFDVMRAASKTEPVIADLLDGLLHERLNNMSRVIDSLSNSLREGLSQEQAAEVLWAVSSPELFRLLTRERGWSSEDYST